MKKKVNEKIQYNQWNPGHPLSASKDHQSNITPLRPNELQKGAKSSYNKKQESNEDYEDYDEGFEKIEGDEDLNEMEKLRQAMAKEKVKA